MRFKLLLVLIVVALANWSAQGAQAKPNVILIMADDFGFECIAANGGESYRTPNFDRLASTGMRFENCHVQPLCTPTRVQLMTGQYNVRNYVDFGTMQPESKTFGNLFRDAGYATAIVGKWQLGQDPKLPKQFGFDEHCLWQHTRRPERYKNPGLEINGKEVDYSKGEYGPDIINAYALDFITRNKEKPFFLYYPMMLTHNPFVPTPDSADYGKSSKPTKTDDKYFGDMVSYADKMVGRIADKLDELKIRENTLIIFLGDNGTYPSVISQFRGKPYEGGKGKQIDTGSHVPLIVNWPKTIKAGQVNSNLVDSTDFLPTICEAAGIKVPGKMSVDGRSFLPQLKGASGKPREWSYCWYAPHANKVKYEYARDLNYKLYRDGTLFNTRNDPQEKSPLTGNSLSKEAKEANVKLAKVLEDFRDARPIELRGELGTEVRTEPAKEKRKGKGKRKQ